MSILARPTSRKSTPVAIAAQALSSPPGRLLTVGVVTMMSVWRLVTQASVVRRLRRQNERIAELEHMKSMYLRLASHELRTPIAVARGYIDLLESGDLGRLSVRTRQALAQINGGLAEVDVLIAEMVEIARMQEGRRLLRVQRLDLREPVHEAWQRVKPLTTSGHHLVVHEPEAPVWVVGDPIRLRAAARNLLENAIKYSPNGGEIGCTVFQREEMASIVVSDEGVGIDSADLDRVFRKFERAWPGDPSAVQGLGLGLHLVREIARAHGGDLRIASTHPGAGSTFVLSLPITDGEDLESPPADPAAAGY